MTSWILILLTFLPFLAAIIAYMLGRRDERAMNGFVSITGIVIFALSVVLLFLPEGEVAVPGFCGLGRCGYAGGGLSARPVDWRRNAEG